LRARAGRYLPRAPQLALAALLVLAAGCARESPPEPPRTAAPAQPAASAPASRVFWGDLHVHSRYSFDSFSLGNRALGPEDAFRFARGEAVRAHTGELAQLRRPLDFLMVSDHAEFLGVLPRLAERDAALLDSELGRRWSQYLADGNVQAIVADYVDLIGRGEKPTALNEPFTSSVWQELNAIAERFNEPGRFTAFIGYEWTSMIAGANLHRNVVFRDGAARTGQALPFSALDSTDPEALWAFLERYERATGGAAIAIPHNGNLSNGAMFADLTVSGKPLDAAYARVRARREPVYEVTQVKGDGEAHPLLSPEDEFADFETWDQGDITMQPKQPGMLAGEYARSALRKGLGWQVRLGANPFRFGMIGSTDSHTTLSTADDDNFFGKFPDSEPSPERLGNRMAGRLWENWRLAASGYAAVWAAENTREALFDALVRREVYATTGPRITVRFFGGWDFTAADLAEPDYARRAYARGVPMGGELPRSRADGIPRFLVAAAKDPLGANLDRIQIVKAWAEADGTTHERVFDVALSDGRRVDPATGHAPRLASSVDPETASYRNDSGAAELSTVWEDPDFDPGTRAAYYARVIEIPTPRWTAYDRARFGVLPGAEVPLETTERAYTSPIWYTPH